MNKTLIRFGAAYMVGPIFVKGENDDIYHDLSASNLSISTGLKNAIDAWDSKYQETLNNLYPPDSGFKTKAEKEQHDREGFELSNRLQQELGEGYVVEYRVPP